MKISTIQISYDTEKLYALRQYVKDGKTLEEGLEVFLQAQYEKHVPSKVRETIEGQKAGDTI